MYRNVLIFLFFSTVLVTCDAASEEKNVDTVFGAVTDEASEDTEWLFGVIEDILEEDFSNGNGTQVEESRKKKDNQPQQSFMEKILPMMVTPFMVSTSMIPMMLVSIFFMLMKSAFVGKIGIILLLINMFRNRTNPGGFFTHNVGYHSRQGELDVAMEHYGYHGDEEYGAYVNRRRRR